LTLTGVVDDGSARAATVPESTKTVVDFAAGTDVTILLTVVNNAGAAVDLSPVGTVVTFTIQKRLDSARASVRATGTVDIIESSKVTFAIAAEDTVHLTPGVYFFDVGLVLSDKTYQVVELSKVTLTATLSGSLAPS